MFTQLPEGKKDLIKALYKKHQPNCSALSCYFEGKMPGKAYVDDVNAPTKAICRLEMSWTYVSDDADLPWIEEVLGELVKTTWMQVVWVPERKGQYPLKDISKPFPRLEYIERKKEQKEPCKVDIYQLPYTKEFYATVPDGYKEWHVQNYGSIEEFFNKAWGFYAVDNGKVCAESEGAFMSGGYAEMGIYTFEEYRNRGFAYALCLRTIQELEKMGVKAIWACDKKNLESDRLAQRLGYVNPVEYEFIYFPAQN